ncbi:MAG: Fis family transcriptional regulator, partial [Pseudomonadota bacterium]
VVTFSLPPLRDRLEDIPLLADKFLDDGEKSWQTLPNPLKQRLASHTYPGNVRELRNLLERSSYLEGFDDIDPLVFPTEMRGLGAVDTEFKLAANYMKPFKEAKEALISRFEREYLKRLMARNMKKVAKAAREAKIDRKYLYMLLEKHGMPLPSDDET